MRQTVRALVFHGPHDIRIERVPEPLCGPDDVLLDVMAVGVCGSDVHGYAGQTGRRTAGVIMGHELTAEVSAVGERVVGWHAGDRVCVNPVLGCRRCAVCLAGESNRCLDRRVLGVSADLVGAFSERIVAPAANLVRLGGTSESPYGGALVEPLAVGLHAARQGRIGPGSVTAVIGLGMIGLACVWAAMREGADVVYAFDLDADRVEAAKRLDTGGIVRSLAAREGSLADALPAQGCAGVDVVIDAVGLSQSCADAIRATKPGGTVVLVGMGSPTVLLSAYDLTSNERELIGSFCYSEAAFVECAAAVSSGNVEAKQFIDNVVTLDEAPQIFRELASRSRSSIKTIILPNG